ncbi:hypothetical protein [Bulleidia sp. zg-1006]|uniref:putative ABC transporter permease subunit n=1 Tax=Bulleidia sp. zg-1006 TaxID=2806552 RepID=UPI00193978E6|nr:hypothetical protein [Bulleidia sp. zg-1006]QRG87421.1 hypothetical protein JOS54_03690 [Bulleidia sp. zg-1006]
MSKFFKLMKVQMLNYWLQGNAKTIRSQLLKTIGASVIALAIVSFYAAMFFKNASASTYPILFFVVATIVIFMSFISTSSIAQSTFFEFKDYDMLASLPVEKKWISLSKFLAAMLNQWAFALLLLIPIYCIYAINSSPTLVFSLYYFIGMLLLPAIPVSIGVLNALFFRWITAGTRYENLLKNLLNLALILFWLVYSFTNGYMTSGGGPATAKAAQTFGQENSNSWYLAPAKWFSFGSYLEEPKYLLYLFISAVISIGIITILYLKLFDGIHHRSAMTYHVKNFKLTKAKGGSVFTVLMKREFKILITNFVAALNVFLLPAIAIFGGLYVYFKAPSYLIQLVSKEGKEVLPYAIYFVTVFTSLPAYCSACINVEGTRFWIIRSLPVSEKKFLLVKHSVGILMTGIGPLIFLILCALRFEFNLSMFLIGLATVVSIVILSNGFALLMNLLLPKMIYDTPDLAIKKGGIGSILGSMIPHFGLIALFGVFVVTASDGFSKQIDITWSLWILIAIITVIAIVIETILWIYGPKRIRGLG